MPHVELPLQTGHHVTFVHFPRRLTNEEATTVLRGLDHVGKQGIDMGMYWTDMAFVGPRSNIPARLVEDSNGVFTAMRAKLIEGLDHFGIPYSNDYAGYTPHVTNPPTGVIPWTLAPIRPMLVLVQKPHRVEVTFGG